MLVPCAVGPGSASSSGGFGGGHRALCWSDLSFALCRLRPPPGDLGGRSRNQVEGKGGVGGVGQLGEAHRCPFCDSREPRAALAAGGVHGRGAIMVLQHLRRVEMDAALCAGECMGCVLSQGASLLVCWLRA